MNDLQPYALNGMDISRFTLLQVGNMNSIFLLCLIDKAIHTIITNNKDSCPRDPIKEIEALYCIKYTLINVTGYLIYAFILELVSKELNHLAAILHVYAGGLIFMK